MTARRIALALLVPLLVLAGCSGDDGGDGEGATEPTDLDTESTDGGDGDAETAARALFERDLDAAFLGQGTYSAPVLVLPAADGLPWTLGGWQLDPKRQQSTATVWESLDARTWITIPLPDLDPTIGSETLVDLTVHGGERWALGQLGEGDGVGLWSTEGAEWSAVDAVGFGEGLYPEGITSNGKSMLAWASTARAARPVLFTSSDGRAFERLDDRFTEGDSRGIGEITWTSAGWLAAGWIAEGEATVPVVWLSTDADTWTRVDLPTTGSTRSWASSVVVGPAGIVVGGTLSQGGQPGLPVSWRSADGTTWEDPLALPLHDDGRTTSGDLILSSLASDGSTIVAGGGSAWRPHVWTSGDGGSWQLAPNPITSGGFEQGLVPSGVGIAGGTTVLTSSTPATFVLDGDHWTEVGRATGAITAQTEWPYAYGLSEGPDGGIVVVGSASTPPGPGQEATDTPVVWTSGEDWTRTALPALGGFAAAVTLGPGGLIAVGAEDFASAASSPGDFNPDAMVWHSADGSTWSFLTPGWPVPAGADRTDPEVMAAYRATEGLLGGVGTQRLNAVVAMGAGFVAAGTDYWNETGTGVDAWVVSSTDLEDGTDEAVQEPVVGDDVIRALCTDGSVVAAVGLAEDANGQVDSAAWLRSADGTWSRVDLAGLRAVGYDDLTGCVHDGERFVAVGSLSDGDLQFPVVVTSADGRSWSLVEIDDDADADTIATSVAALPGGGAVIVGDDVSGGDVVVWHLTPDGELLRRIDTGDDALTAAGTQRSYAVAVVGDEVVVIGEDVGGVGLWRSATLLRQLAGSR